MQASDFYHQAVMLWLAWVVLVVRRSALVISTSTVPLRKASPLCSSALVLQSAELVHGFTILLLHFDSQAYPLQEVCQGSKCSKHFFCGAVGRPRCTTPATPMPVRGS